MTLLAIIVAIVTGVPLLFFLCWILWEIVGEDRDTLLFLFVTCICPLGLWWSLDYLFGGGS